MNWWMKFKQSLYPKEFQIARSDQESDSAAWTCLMVEIVESFDRNVARPTEQPAPARQDEPVSVPEGPDKGFVIDLGNHVHRLSRSIKRTLEQGGAETEKLKGPFDRLMRMLDEHSIKVEDLTGQAFDPGRTDFELLGEPQVVAGLARKTIIQCERPLIRLDGKIIQNARGIVGRPPE